MFGTGWQRRLWRRQLLTVSRGDLTGCVREAGFAWSVKQMISRGGRTMDDAWSRAVKSTGITAYKTEDDDDDDDD